MGVVVKIWGEMPILSNMNGSAPQNSTDE